MWLDVSEIYVLQLADVAILYLTTAVRGLTHLLPEQNVCLLKSKYISVIIKFLSFEKKISKLIIWMKSIKWT